MRIVLRGWWMAALMAVAAQAVAGLGPENVLVVANASDATSVSIAREYVRLRRVPESNLVMLANAPSGSTVSLQDFRARVLQPVLASMKARRLDRQIACVAYSSGFPYAVDISPAMEGRSFPRYITQPASLTGLTYLHTLLDAAEPVYLAMDANWYHRGILRQTRPDPRSASDTAPLRDREDYRRLIEGMGTAMISVDRPRPFDPLSRWSVDGTPTKHPSGRRYLLACMLAYVGDRANSAEEALACLRRSAMADFRRPRGTIYFMVSGDQARTGPRQWAFEPAKTALSKLGVRAEVLQGVLPPQRDDVAGAVIGAATVDWRSSGSRILPGAFCDHLTSLAGVMTGGGQTLLSEWLRHGAAGSSGTVTEPYNIAAKFPSAFLHVFYASGCSLAEAFYQSVAGPYQQLLVGDPLCAPWARPIRVRVAGMKPGDALTRPAMLRPSASGAQPVHRFELYVDGVLAGTSLPGKPLKLNPAGLRTGRHEARIVAVAGSLAWRGRAVIPFRVAARQARSTSASVHLPDTALQ